MVESKFLDAVTDEDGMYVYELEREIALLKANVSESETALYFLSQYYHEGCIKVLRANGYKDEIPEEEVARLKAVEVIANKVAAKKLSLETKEKQYDDYMAARAKTPEPTEDSFLKLLSKLAKFQGVALIRAKDITAAEFLALLKEYVASVTAKESSKEKEDGWKER